ncbi:MAG: CPBP family glutamic-type intramembrane protease [Myxococcota bacterium]
MAAAKKDSGWAPYWAPYLSFMLLIEIGNRAPESAAGLFLALKVVVPAACVVFYAARGRYPELSGLHWDGRVGLDVAIGLLGAALWVVPFVAFDGLRPEEGGFDRFVMGEGEGAVALALTLRGVGYACVTPFVEELFVRSWLLRFVDVFDRRRDFRKVPIARFTWRSFLVVVGFFVFTHVPWEWGVMLAWTLLTMAWFYHRGHLLPLVIVHAVTNGAIFAFVLLFDGRFQDGQGVPIPLWFFL